MLLRCISRALDVALIIVIGAVVVGASWWCYLYVQEVRSLEAQRLQQQPPPLQVEKP